MSNANASTADPASLMSWVAVLAPMIGAFMAMLNIQIADATPTSCHMASATPPPRSARR